MKRTYFYQTKVVGGRFVNIIYESENRKGTINNRWDRICAMRRNRVEEEPNWHVGLYSENLFTYLMTRKNMSEQCFEDRETIDCR